MQLDNIIRLCEERNAYPLMNGETYLGAVIGAVILLGEQLSLQATIGIVMIAVGMFFVAHVRQ